jgi:hypothetical protein
VVRDLNGNGTIDSGRELFGDNTILTRGARAGQVAANGFEALADLDSNADGKFNSAELAGSLLLASNNFFREFTDDRAIESEVKAFLKARESGASCYEFNVCACLSIEQSGHFSCIEIMLRRADALSANNARFVRSA